MKFSNIYEEVKGWKHAGRDLTAMRRDKIEAGKEFVVHQLNANGQPSKMPTAITKYSTEEEALKWINYWKQINPGRKLRYSLNGKEV